MAQPESAGRTETGRCSDQLYEQEASRSYQKSEGAKGVGKTYRISALGKDLVVLPQSSAEHTEALRKAALMPVIYESLWTRFGPELPADSLIRSYLVRDRNFNAHQVDGMIADFRSTVEFAGLSKEAADIAPETKSIGQILDRYAAMRTTSGAHVMPAAIASPSEVFTIPLEDGKMASIPYPMSEQAWEPFMDTLKLWKPRLVAAAERTSEGSRPPHLITQTPTPASALFLGLPESSYLQGHLLEMAPGR